MFVYYWGVYLQKAQFYTIGKWAVATDRFCWHNFGLMVNKSIWRYSLPIMFIYSSRDFPR